MAYCIFRGSKPSRSRESINRRASFAIFRMDMKAHFRCSEVWSSSRTFLDRPLSRFRVGSTPGNERAFRQNAFGSRSMSMVFDSGCLGKHSICLTILAACKLIELSCDTALPAGKTSVGMHSHTFFKSVFVAPQQTYIQYIE